MLLLIAGLCLFYLSHIIPIQFPSLREKVVTKLGTRTYKILYTLDSLFAFVLIVLGWQSISSTEQLYYPPAWGMHVTYLFASIGLLLFIASNAPTNIRRILRHPQLLGVTFWGTGHLFSNGELRSVILFGGFIAFSLHTIWASNKRDGEWVKREKVPVYMDVITISIGLSVIAAAMYFHEYITGIPIM